MPTVIADTYALLIADSAGNVRVWERGRYANLKRLAAELPANGWAYHAIVWTGQDRAAERVA